MLPFLTHITVILGLLFLVGVDGFGLNVESVLSLVDQGGRLAVVFADRVHKQVVELSADETDLDVALAVGVRRLDDSQPPTVLLFSF